jgi:hypothetical protein
MYICKNPFERNIKRLDVEKVINISILLLSDMKISDVEDTWSNARSTGRAHEGTDMIVSRGILVLFPTDSVVTRIETTRNEGLNL